ncbi:hypothetical protein IJ579_07065 [bacterium]|nr:hypothetical protein [bacterium]
MSKKQIILLVICFAFLAFGKVLSSLDEKYGDTIPTIVYQQNHSFDKKIYDNNVNSRHVYIYASYPSDIESLILKYPTLSFIEETIVKNWKPYIKQDNDVVIVLKINKDGSKEYKFLGNTGIYAAANAARSAVLSPTFVGENIVEKADSVELIYRFTVSNN